VLTIANRAGFAKAEIGGRRALSEWPQTCLRVGQELLHLLHRAV